MADQPKSALPYVLGNAIFQNGTGALLAYFFGKGGCLTYPDVDDVKNACLAICLYILIVYLFMFRQALSKIVNAAVIEKYGSEKIVVEFLENTNRTFENACEQMPIFLGTYFIYTLLVDPSRAATLGVMYCIFLVLYPAVFGGMQVMISTLPRYLIVQFMLWSIIFAALSTGNAPSPAPAHTFDKGESMVYSNSKYLADFQSGMSLAKCEKMCTHWDTFCEDLCEEKHKCGLSDEVDARHFTRDVSCGKTCIGFNMHNDGHCTLFPDSVELRHGGRGQWYGRPGHNTPALQTLFGIIQPYHAQNLMTPFFFVVGAIAVAGLGFFAVRWSRHPRVVEDAGDRELFLATEE